MQLDIEVRHCTYRIGGETNEVRASVFTESPLGYHPCNVGFLTAYRDPVPGQCLVGSLTGAVASQRVTEAPKVPSVRSEIARRV